LCMATCCKLGYSGIADRRGVDVVSKIADRKVIVCWQHAARHGMEFQDRCAFAAFSWLLNSTTPVTLFKYWKKNNMT
jgi:hypothetical protein